MFLFDIELRTSGDFWLSMLLLRCFSLEKDVSLILQFFFNFRSQTFLIQTCNWDALKIQEKLQSIITV